MKSIARILFGGLAAVCFALTSAQAASDRPVVRMPAIEQGSEVRGDQLVDIVMKPADDGAPLLKVDLIIDNEEVVRFDLQPSMRNVTFNWPTGSWSDGRHEIVAVVKDARGREGRYQTFVYVWNQGRPGAVTHKAASVEVTETDPVPDGVITQRALIQVKVDPSLGAKWVILYLNDELIAMMNYPPYRAEFDPAKRQRPDGPYVVRAKVIHPDNTETYTDPVKFDVNLSGSYTPIRPDIASRAPAVTPTVAAPAMSPAMTAPSLPPTDLPGPAVATDASPVAAPPALGAARANAPTLMRPPVADGGTVNLEVLGARPSGPAAAGATVPTVPATHLPTSSKTAATRRVLGPLQPAQTGAGAAQTVALRETFATQPAVSAASGASRLATPPTSARLAPPRSGSGQATGRDAMAAELRGTDGRAADGAARAGVPGLRVLDPRRSGGRTQTPDAALAGGDATAPVTLEGAPRTGAPSGTRPLPAIGPLPPATASGGVAPPAPTVSAPRGLALPPVDLPRTAGGETAAPMVVTPSRGTLPPQVTGPRAAPAPKAAAPAVPKATAVKPSRLIGRMHTVSGGDTLYSLAKKYQVTVAALAKVNNVTDVHLIRIGQKLVIPGGELKVDGRSVRTDVAPVQIRRGVATSPFRYVVEALGGTVTWMGPSDPRVQATTKDRGMITINIGSKQAQVNEQTVLMDLAAYLDSGRTMVPTRFISEALDVTVELDPDSGNILIRSNR